MNRSLKRCVVASIASIVALILATTINNIQNVEAASAATPATFNTSQWCSQSTGVSTYFGAASSGALLTSSVSTQCSLPQFVAVPNQQYAGAFNFNLRGDYVYTAPNAQVVDVIFVDVFCFNNAGVSIPLCRQTFVAEVSAPFTLAPVAAATTTPVPSVATCPVVYHFTAITGSVLSASLRTAVGQPSCPYGTWYEVGRLPNFGRMNLVANGDFSYTAPEQQTWDDFGYTLYCFNEVLCRGSAYVLVSGTAAPTSAAPSSPGTNNGGAGGGEQDNNGIMSRNPQLTCQSKKSCVSNSWKATPDSPPYKWEHDKNNNPQQDSVLRSDGVKVGTVRASYNNGSVVLSIFGKVGNLAQRFPTFEPFRFQSGETLSASNVLSRVSETSVAFNVKCLSKQPGFGMGEEVWHWTSLANRTGTLGALHNSGGSWYQKFGGAHDMCDSFMEDSCNFAPLLTPKKTQDPNTGGVWSVDINGCDATWTGRFSLAALRNMKKKDGSAVWSVTEGRTVRTTLYLQAIQPTSWLQPIKGYQTDLIAKPLVLTLDPDVSVTLGSVAEKLFSIDTIFKTYQQTAAEQASNSNGGGNAGDFAFSLDMRLYPHVAKGATSSYQAGRHVSGFRWIDQRWITPDRSSGGCPSCTGTESHCTTDPRAPTNTYFTADVGGPNSASRQSCTNPVVSLTKGPGMQKSECLHNLMYIYNRPGLSAPEACAHTFQNLTIRGVAPGSGRTPGFFGFEGSIHFQLILDTGIPVTIRVEISRFVSMMSVDGSGVTGTTRMCRASSYWPVLDPLGTSLPTVPYFLSPMASDPAPKFLCASRSRTFGPTTWATVVLDLDKSNDVVIESLSLDFDSPSSFSGESVYFISRDPVSGRNGVLPPVGDKKRTWWNTKYPFFNFRDLSEMLNIYNNTEDVITVPMNEPQMEGNVDFAAAFTPGAIGSSASATLTFSARIRNADGSLGGHVTLRSLMHLDELLSDRDILGFHFEPQVEILSPVSNTYVAIFASGGLIVGVFAVLAIFIGVDTSKPLPTWIPNAHELRDVIMTNIMQTEGSEGIEGLGHHHKGAGHHHRGATAGGMNQVEGIPIPTITL